VVLALACPIGLVIAWWSAAGAGSVSETTGYILVAVFALVVSLAALPVLLAAAALALAAMNHAVSRVHMGQTTTIREAYKSVWPRCWRYTGLLILEGLMIGAAPLAAWIALVFLVAGAAAWAQRAGMESIAGAAFLILAVVLVVVALIGFTIWMLLRLSLAFPACVVEQIGAWTAIKRSAFLCTGTKGRIFVLYLLVAMLGWLLSMGVTMPLTILLVLLPGLSDPQHAQIASVVIVIISYGASFAVQALIRPVYGIALVLFLLRSAHPHGGLRH